MPRNPKSKKPIQKAPAVPQATPGLAAQPKAVINSRKAQATAGVAQAGALDFLVKTLITINVHNAAGVEEKRVHPVVFALDKEGAEKPWYVLRNYLVPAWLSKNVGVEGVGYTKIVEIKIQKMVNRRNTSDVSDIPLRVMTMEQVELYVKSWEYPIKPTDFHNVEKAREMIALYEEDPAGYDAQYHRYMSGKGRKNPEMDKYRQGFAGSEDTQALASEFESLSEKPLVASPGRGGQVSGPLTPEEESMLGSDPVDEQPAVAAPVTPAVSGAVKDPFAAV